MIRNAMIACAAALTISAGALAHAETFRAKFSYDPNASAEEIYAGFKEAAHDVCLDEARRGGKLPMRTFSAIRKSCEANLLGSVVSKLDRAQVTALHRRSIGDNADVTLAQAQ